MNTPSTSINKPYKYLNLEEKRKFLIDFAIRIYTEQKRVAKILDFEKNDIYFKDIVEIFGNLQNLLIAANCPVRRRKNMTDDELKEYLKSITTITESGCWITTVLKSELDGRKQINYHGRATYIYRLAYKLFKGPLDNNLCIMHDCDNPQCFNPDHLSQGTKKENSVRPAERLRGKPAPPKRVQPHSLSDPYNSIELLKHVRSVVSINEKEEWIYPHGNLRAYPRIVIKRKAYTLHRLLLANKIGKRYEDIDYACHRFPEGSLFINDRPSIYNVNPDHLYEGTASQNGKDAMVYSKNTVLSNDKIEEIVKIITETDFTELDSPIEFDKKIASLYKVSTSMIHRIRTEHTGVAKMGIVFDRKKFPSQPIIQSDLNKKFIKKWDSIREAVKQLGFGEHGGRTGIRQTCKKEIGHYRDFLWEYESDYNTRKYIEEGYLVIPKFFKKLAIDEIYNDATEIFKLQLKHHNYYSSDQEFEQNLYKFFLDKMDCFINCGKQIQHLISLHRLSICEKLINQLNLLGLKFPNIATRPTIFFNNKNLATKDIYHTVPAHQDNASMSGSSNSLVVWFPLMNVTNNLGALQVVPKSHMEGLLTDTFEEGFGLVNKYTDSDFISVELDKGDALFFSSYLVHRSGSNVTDHIRWAAHYRYNDMLDKDFIDRDYPHPYIYKPITKQ